jgi:hypothetical protein
MTSSLIISIIVAVGILLIQLITYRRTTSKLDEFQSFFNQGEEGKHSIIGDAEEAQLDTTKVIAGTPFAELLNDLNVYLKKNRGTTDFSIIQNKTERKISSMYEYATSRLAFPTYIGLIGTFLGVFMGLLFFTIGLTGDGISDAVIGNLIYGVLVSMITSLVGLILSTRSNYHASEAKKIVDNKKNEFFEFIQNELLPSLGVSMVAALNKLHATINLFEPSFNRVIDKFQTTFDGCTQEFGHAFELNVKVVADAVKKMGQNMDKINDNVELQDRLLKTLRSHGVVATLDAFVNAAQRFENVSESITRYEEMCTAIKNQTDVLIERQRTYTESLSVPAEIASRLNTILNRFTTFEDSINNLGMSIAQTKLIGNNTIDAIKQQVEAIRQKQAIAVQYIETSDGQLEDIFKLQNAAIAKLNQEFEASLLGYSEQFETELKRLSEEIKKRRAEIVAQIDEKFSIAEIRKEFSQLEKLSSIESLLTTINSKVSDTKIQQIIDSARHEIANVTTVLAKMESEMQTNAQASVTTERMQKELAPLQKLNSIEDVLKTVSKNTTSENTERALSKAQQELANLHSSLDAAIKEIRENTNTILQQQKPRWGFFR